MIPFPNKKYSVLYVDPPWEMKKSKRVSRPNQLKLDYPTMKVDEILALPVPKLCKSNCCLFLWATHKHLPNAFNVMREWGFKYQRTVCWDKGNGMCLFGFHHRTEFLLFGYRGAITAFPRRAAFPTIVAAKSARHSEKPQVFRDLIRPFGHSRIELFARQRVPGWDAWGNEV